MKKQIVLTYKIIFYALMSGFPFVNLFSQSLLSTFGKTQTVNNRLYTYSVGEAVVFTGSVNNVILTQGFQQPKIGDSLQVNVIIQQPTCLDATDGSILMEIFGCNSCYVVWVDNNDTTKYRQNLPPGEYVVMVYGNAGQWQDTIRLSPQFERHCNIIVYSGFSPNSDGVNDAWIIENINLYLPNKVEIYNRWGVKVWQGQNYDNNTVVWRGENIENGKILPPGTYFYLIEISNQTLKGWVQLTK
ncbi:MAG: hypothetical protein KatS3mg027_2703 [Bacteroidia bacterium]|nr:MAG: hypothetical protein KatS3mg027_2703 [Bacteroidia bacterium]